MSSAVLGRDKVHSVKAAPRSSPELDLPSCTQRFIDAARAKGELKSSELFTLSTVKTVTNSI